MTKLRITLTIAALLIFSSAQAEIFQGINHGYSLAKIKDLFPLAEIKPVAAAWVTKDDGFYKLSGNGFPGVLYMAFSDSRPTFKKLQTEAEAEEATNASPANDNPRSKTWKILAEQDTDNALAISWIRWVPDSPIPLQRYISKYGKPEKTGFADSDMRPYASWPKKNIHANLSDDEKFVNNVEFGFTKQEKIAACHERTAKKFWPTSCNYSD
ncbi:hypothetical protein ABIE30_000972 [Janthinobacterium lividum]|uniref:hypothetical protein n=1 Tax=Janthinobacterium lividum TaxID=29581 RepID=UPI003D1BE44E